MHHLVQVAPECPVCSARHRHSFAPEDLAELLKNQPLNFYGPRADRSWPASPEQRDALNRILACRIALG
jgi:hypothetical protein